MTHVSRLGRSDYITPRREVNKKRPGPQHFIQCPPGKGSRAPRPSAARVRTGPGGPGPAAWPRPLAQGRPGSFRKGEPAPCPSACEGASCARHRGARISIPALRVRGGVVAVRMPGQIAVARPPSARGVSWPPGSQPRRVQAGPPAATRQARTAAPHAQGGGAENRQYPPLGIHPALAQDGTQYIYICTRPPRRRPGGRVKGPCHRRPGHMERHRGGGAPRRPRRPRPRGGPSPIPPDGDNAPPGAAAARTTKEAASLRRRPGNRGRPSGTRTPNQWIKSPLLYQLS